MAPNEQISGGAQIGWGRASWPLATLSASANNLSVSANLLGSYSFSPDEVVALEAHGWIPIVGRGIRVVHSRSDYPAKIVFWCFWTPDRVIEYIRNTGFVPRASSASLPMRQGIPVRWPAIVLAVVLWNTLLLIDGFVPWNNNPTPGPFVFLALSLLFAASLTVHRSVMAQSLVLKQGRSVDEVRGILVLVQVVTGALIFLMLVFGVLGVLPGNPR
jgi:hypothetical protein